MNSQEEFKPLMWQLSEVVWEMTAKAMEFKKKNPNVDISRQMKNLRAISNFEMLYYELCFQRDDAVNIKKELEFRINLKDKELEEKQKEINKLLLVIENL